MVTLNKNIFQTAGQKLDWLTTRQNLLSQNVMNAGTPNYLPQDLKKFSAVVEGGASGTKKGLDLVKTHASHRGESNSVPSVAEVVSVEDPNNISPNGNGVFVELELMKSSETGLKVQEAVALVDRYSRMRKTALFKK